MPGTDRLSLWSLFYQIRLTLYILQLAFHPFIQQMHQTPTSGTVLGTMGEISAKQIMFPLLEFKL